MLRSIRLAILALVLPAPIHAQDSLDMVQAGARFCEFLQQRQTDTGPGHLLTQNLANAISAALERNHALQAETPDEKPPLGDGVPWTSFPDRPDGCTIGAADMDGDSATLPVTYGFAGAPDAAYTDTLVLRHEDGAWRIADVVFIQGQHLLHLLESVAAP